MAAVCFRSTVICVLASLWSFQAVSATLFPANTPELEFSDMLMPNVERSVRDCPFTIYEQGGYALASSIFGERYIDKSFSHTVRVLSGDVTCVGLIVDETHVLTTSECNTSEDEPLPKIKLANDTIDAIGTVEMFSNPDYNVTLLRLNSTIKASVLSVPTCFWDVSYEDGFDKIQSIFVAPNGSLAIEETKCTFQNRKQCLGDLLKTGTLLQTRAIASWHMHPFVFTFGSDEDGLALPISKYLGWMETVTEKKIQSSECVAKYKDFREYEDSMVSRSDNYQSAQYSKSRMSGTSIGEYKVRIVPNTTETGSKRHCYGSLIGPKFILTTANCLKQYNVDSYKIEMGQRMVYYPVEDNSIRVRTVSRKVHYHPEFDPNTLANDIALVELVTPIYRFNKTLVPACVWTHDKLPVDQYQTNGYVPYNETNAESVRTNQLYATADVYEECVDKVPEHRFCAGFPTALAPNMCHNSIGSAMSRSMYRFNRFFEYIFAINSQGENCGFNMPTVFTSIAPYVQWIDSVVYATGVQFEDNSNFYGDSCQDANGANGTCVSLQQCPKLNEIVKQGAAVNPSSTCSFGKQNDMVVCCSDANVLRDETHRDQLAQAVEEIDSCPHLYHEHRKPKPSDNEENVPTYPYMVRIHGKDDRSCNGTLVSKQFVLTTALCYQRLAQDEVKVVSGNSTRQTMTVRSTFRHPEFSDNPTEFNLILLKLDHAVTISNESIPACLWHNRTHTPLRLEVVFGNPYFRHQYRFPLFNKNCQHKYANSNVTSLQLCISNDKKYYQPYVDMDTDTSSVLVSHFVHEHQVTYLIGLFGSSYKFETPKDEIGDEFDSQSFEEYSVYQRTSEYYNWIKNVITVEMQKDDQ